MSSGGSQEWLPEWLSGAGESAAARPENTQNRLARLREKARGRIAQFGRQALEIVYPPSCIACRRATMHAGTLCAPCWGAMPFIERPYCERLGTPFAQDLGPGLISPEAFANPPVFNRARAVARYDEGPARDLVHNLKYGDRLELADAMGRWMARAGAELLADADLVVPIPLHRKRLFSRRFNQAALLAQVVAAQTGRTSDPFALARVKATTPQVGLTRAQRADNVQGAFRVPDEAKLRISRQKILLVDDVLTTGATLNAASRVLLRAGATRVDILVFARVVQGPGLAG
jgi:ComF family protein